MLFEETEAFSIAAAPCAIRQREIRRRAEDQPDPRRQESTRKRALRDGRPGLLLRVGDTGLFCAGNYGNRGDPSATRDEREINAPGREPG